VEPTIDMDYHVRRLALPQPGSRAQLERIVERLHARMLDRTRPLWECYVIEGLAGGQFAVYTKMHHALVDGVAGVMLAMAALRDRPDAPAIAPWSIEVPEPSDAPRPGLLTRMRQSADTLRGLQRMGLEQSLGWLSRGIGERPGADLPFAAPKTSFNGWVDGHRRFATRTLSMARVKAVAKATDATLNDVVLALLGSALRSWLAQQDALPGRSLTASCPVSVRSGDGVGNNLSALLCDLATDETDPLARLTRVLTSTRRGKRQIAGLSSGAAEAWALSVGLLGLAPALVNGGQTLPPLANLVVSNVPGPHTPRYLAGAELLGYFPVSVLTHGQGLNITLLSRAGALDFGFIGARSLVSDLGLLGDALEAALTEMEAAVETDLSRRSALLRGIRATDEDASQRHRVA
jgi:WS/DGAT/MGAT family acyltransferase